MCHEEVLVADAFLSLYAFRGVSIGEQHVGGVRRSVTLKKERRRASLFNQRDRVPRKRTFRYECSCESHKS